MFSTIQLGAIGHAQTSVAIEGRAHTETQSHVDSSKDSLVVMKRQPCSRQDRLRQLDKICSNGSIDSSPKWNKYLSRLMVDQKHKALYCVIPKCGCSTWKTLMVNLTGLDPDLRDGVAKGVHKAPYLAKTYNLTYLSTHSIAKRQVMLDTYFKFIVVRHPMDRLCSAFLGKLIHDGQPIPYYRHLGMHLKKHYGHRHLSEMDKPVKFSEFLMYISSTGRRHQNLHWSSYIDLCNPCKVKYDYIVKLETSNDDSSFIVNRLGGKSYTSELPRTNGRRHRMSSSRRLDLYRDVPDVILDKVLKNFEVDMKLFGYEWNSKTLTASCSQKSGDGECC